MQTTSDAYRRHLLAHLPTLVDDSDTRERLTGSLERLVALMLLDLEPARALLVQGYSRRAGGRRPRDPVVLLRALVLMFLSGMTSINQFVRRLRGEPELRVLVGLKPSDKVPGVGTFYDFLARLVDGPYQPKCAHRERPSQRLRGRKFSRQLRQEKETEKAKCQAELAHKNQGRVQQLVDARLSTLAEPLPGDLEQRLNEILARCALVPSAAAGVLGDLRRLLVSGDGTSVRSHGEGHGRPVCNCKQEGQADCACPRSYSDPDATWGYDSHREQYYFGNRVHVLATRGQGDDLPLHLSIAGAHTPDVVMGVDALVRLVKRLREPDIGGRIRAGIWDAGYDAGGFYRMHQKLEISPLIPLAQEVKTPACADEIPRNAEGTPLCVAGVPMRLHQRDPGNRQLVYNCPVKRPGRDKGKIVFRTHAEECPRGTLCEPSSVMGPIVHLRLEGDPRMNLPIPRNTAEFAELFKERTSTERFNSSFKSKGRITRGAFRRQHLTLAAAVMHAIGLHAGAWVGHTFGKDKPKTVDQALDWLRGAVSAAQPLAA